jgi:hypothetical protein
MKKVTKNEMKQFNEWKDATSETVRPLKSEIEFDVHTGLDSMHRVQYLKTLGYKITNWDEYAQAEINEMGQIVKAA